MIESFWSAWELVIVVFFWERNRLNWKELFFRLLECQFENDLSIMNKFRWKKAKLIWKLSWSWVQLAIANLLKRFFCSKNIRVERQSFWETFIKIHYIAGTPIQNMHHFFNTFKGDLGHPQYNFTHWIFSKTLFIIGNNTPTIVHVNVVSWQMPGSARLKKQRRADHFWWKKFFLDIRFY